MDTIFLDKNEEVPLQMSYQNKVPNVLSRVQNE